MAYAGGLPVQGEWQETAPGAGWSGMGWAAAEGTGMGWSADEGTGVGMGWVESGWPAEYSEGGPGELWWAGEAVEEPDEVMRLCSVLWVGSLPPRCTEEEVLAAFRNFGPIASIVVKNQQQHGLYSSLAFVNFMDEAGALTAYGLAPFEFLTLRTHTPLPNASFPDQS